MTRPTRHLFTFLTDQNADLHLARRGIAHDRLVILVTDNDNDHGRAEDLAATERHAAGPDAAHVIALPPHDMDRALERLGTLITDLPPADTVTINLAGANPAHLSAAMILAFDRGIPAVVAQHGKIVPLPILSTVRLEDRLEPDERTVLARLTPAPQAVEHLAQHLLVPKTRIHKAGRTLKDKGVASIHVANGTTHLQLTEQGDRLRAHLT